jgi:hypothetical protein
MKIRNPGLKICSGVGRRQSRRRGARRQVFGGTKQVRAVVPGPLSQNETIYLAVRYKRQLVTSVKFEWRDHNGEIRIVDGKRC